MALPTTITGFVASVDGTRFVTQPFLSSGGNVYVFGRGSTSTLLRAFKATDPTSSFSNVGSDITISDGDVEAVAAFQVGDVIHVATMNGAASSRDVRYHTFNMATDAWVITNEAVVENFDNQFAADPYPINIMVRSDGDVIIFYPGASVANMGSQRGRVYYARRESASWTVDVSVDDGGGSSWLVQGLVSGSSDRTHFFFMDYNTGDAYQRTLTSANALETFPSTYSNTSIGCQSSGTSYVSGANTKVRFPLKEKTDATTLYSAKCDSADAPSVTVDTDITGSINVEAGTFRASFSADGTTLWNTFIDNTTDGLYIQSNADDAGWGTPASFYDGGTHYGVKTNIYTRGSSIVIAMMTYEGTNCLYHEYEISSTGISGDANFTFDAMTTTAAGVVEVVADASPAFAAMTTTSDADVFVVAESSFTFDAMTVSSTIEQEPAIADADFTFDAMTTTSAAVLPVVAESSTTFATMTLTSDVDVIATADELVNFAAMTTTSAAGVLVVADSTTTFDTMTVVSDATPEIAVLDADFTFADMTTTSAGVVALVIEASITFDEMTVTSEGVLPIEADSSTTFEAMTISSTGTLPVVAESTTNFDTMTISSTATGGDVIIIADSEFTFDTMTVAATTGVLVVALATTTFDTMTATGDITSIIGLSADFTLDNMTTTSAGTLPIVVNGNFSYAAMTVSATVLSAESIGHGLWAFVSNYDGSILDRVHNCLLDNTVGTDVEWTNRDLWLKFFAERGFTAGTYSDRLRAFLVSYTGAVDTGQTIEDLWWLVTGPYIP